MDIYYQNLLLCCSRECIVHMKAQCNNWKMSYLLRTVLAHMSIQLSDSERLITSNLEAICFNDVFE